jgi:DNA repair exonuclease SbcCD nuclease subunit
MDRNDMGDQKGITILDLVSGKIDFVPNTYSPVFKKFTIKEESDIDEMDSLKDTKDYIDLTISNNLLVNNRKLRRKLEMLLTSGNFASVEYLNDIVKSESESEKDVQMSDEELQVSIQLDYEEFIKKYITDQKYENDKFKSGIMTEFNEIIRVYNESYRVKND